MAFDDEDMTTSPDHDDGVNNSMTTMNSQRVFPSLDKDVAGP
jgi:hypothetical protein